MCSIHSQSQDPSRISQQGEWWGCSSGNLGGGCFEYMICHIYLPSDHRGVWARKKPGPSFPVSGIWWSMIRTIMAYHWARIPRPASLRRLGLLGLGLGAETTTHKNDVRELGKLCLGHMSQFWSQHISGLFQTVFWPIKSMIALNLKTWNSDHILCTGDRSYHNSR